MKVKTTRKALLNAYPKAVSIGYCQLQYLLRHEDPMYYTCGVYGWNFDAYVVDGVLLTTGYRGMFGDSVPYETAKSYEDKARKIICSSLSYDEQKNQITALLHDFVKVVA